MEDYRDCSVYRVVRLVEGKWKPFIVYLLYFEALSFNNVWRRIPKISKKVLSSHLKDLTADGVVELSDQNYKLTALGKSLFGLLRTMSEWSEKELPNIVEGTEPVFLPKT